MNENNKTFLWTLAQIFFPSNVDSISPKSQKDFPIKRLVLFFRKRLKMGSRSIFLPNSVGDQVGMFADS